MYWSLIAALAIVIAMLIAIYRRALKQNRDLTHYALLILLDEGVYQSQHQSLREFVTTIEANGAADLGMKVYIATGRLASRLSADALGVAGLLWNLKTQS
jgi:hypothetical protein